VIRPCDCFSRRVVGDVSCCNSGKPFIWYSVPETGHSVCVPYILYITLFSFYPAAHITNVMLKMCLKIKVVKSKQAKKEYIQAGIFLRARIRIEFFLLIFKLVDNKIMYYRDLQ
jgi:hypothetical protein